MTFSSRLSSVIIFYAIFSISLLITGGVYSFKHLAKEDQKYKVSQVVKIIDYELLELSGSHYMAFWVPHWLKANDVIKLELHTKNGIVFSYQDEQQQNTQLTALKKYVFTLQKHGHLELTIWMLPPGQRLHFDPVAISIFLLSLVLVFLSLWLTIVWIKRSLQGAQLLEHRAKGILKTNTHHFAHAHSSEWPKSAAQALDHLIEQLNDAKQDRSRFDSFIRHNAFIDPLTGLGNKLQLRNQLSAELSGSNTAVGVLLLIDLPLLSLLNYQLGEEEGDHILKQTRDTLHSYKKRFTDPLLTRYSGKSFALLLPLVSSHEGELAATAIMKLLYRITLPSSYHREQFFYISVTAYESNDPVYQILDELEMSLRIAKLQGTSNWHMADKIITSTATEKSAVRWRTMLENIVANQKICFYLQAMHDQNDVPFANLLFCKIIDENNNHIPPSIYQPMAHKAGLITALESLFWRLFIAHKTEFKLNKSLLFVPLHSETLQQHKFRRWLKVALLELPLSMRSHIVILFTENQLGEQQDSPIRQSLKELKEIGCKLCISNAGQAVMSTAYIQELDLNYLMLHPGLIHRIDRNPMNQVAIRSLIASGGDLDVQILAQGVSSKKEWIQLKQLGVNGGSGEQLSKESLITISRK